MILYLYCSSSLSSYPKYDIFSAQCIEGNFNSNDAAQYRVAQSPRDLQRRKRNWKWQRNAETYQFTPWKEAGQAAAAETERVPAAAPPLWSVMYLNLDLLINRRYIVGVTAAAIEAASVFGTKMCTADYLELLMSSIARRVDYYRPRPCLLRIS